MDDLNKLLALIFLGAVTRFGEKLGEDAYKEPKELLKELRR